MNIKEIILAGGLIQFSYKEDPKDWVGEAKIYGLSGGWGLKPKIRVEIPTIDLEKGGSKEYTHEQIDEAIADFKRVVFRPKNLMYKMHESMIELYNEGETNLDLEIESHYEKVKKRQEEKQRQC